MTRLHAELTRHLENAIVELRRERSGESRRELLAAALCLLKLALLHGEPESKKRLLELAYKLMGLAHSLPRSTNRECRVKQTDAGEVETAGSWIVTEKPRVRFADIAGLHTVKEEIRLKLIYPFVYPEKAKLYGVRKGGGILLYGPPGTGKTMIAKATAAEIDAPFFNVKPSEIMSKWVGEAEQNIRTLFQTARSHERAVIFIDEVESLIPKRRTSGSTIMQRVVPQILAELEGFEETRGALLFIGATNEPWSLDTAVLRPGRFDDKIYVPLPDGNARRQMLDHMLEGKPVSSDVDLESLAAELVGYSGADIRHLVSKATNRGFMDSIYSGESRLITAEDFEQARQGVNPSVDSREVKRYQAFAFGGVK